MFTHAANLALFAFGQHKAQLLRVLPVDFGGLEGFAVQAQAVAQALKQRFGEDGLHVGADPIKVANDGELVGLAAIGGRCGGGGSGVLVAGVGHAHQVFLFHLGVFADQLTRHAAVLRQHQQTGGIDVQASGGGQAAQMRRGEAQFGRVAAPVAARVDQGDGGFVPVFGLAAHIAHGLVQKNSHLPVLLLFGGFVDGDAVRQRDLLAHAGGQAVDHHPALLDPGVGFAPRAHAQLGHAFVQARGAAGGSGVAFAFGAGGAFESRGLGHGVCSVRKKAQ